MTKHRADTLTFFWTGVGVATTASVVAILTLGDAKGTAVLPVVFDVGTVTTLLGDAAGEPLNPGEAMVLILVL